jgi:hypothetical protein
MGMAVEIKVGEIDDRFVGPPGGDLTHSHESSEALNDFDIDQVRRMELVPVAKKAGFDSDANRGLQEKLQQRRRVNDDHTDSRSSRITTAAGVFSVTRFRLWRRASMSSRVGRAARRSSSARR